MSEPKTLQEAVVYYSDPDNCLRKLASKRWPKGAICPGCGSSKVSFNAQRRTWKCSSHHPKREFSVKVGTIFEDSALPLSKWLVALWMIVNCKNGVSSYEIHRALGVTQKTAWFMNHRIRLALQSGSFDKLGGEVEVDETYIGGKARNMHIGKRREKIIGSGMVGKIAVMGLLERHGEVRTRIIDDASQDVLRSIVRTHVKSGSQLFTDNAGGYRGIDSEAEYIHNVIDHAEAYAKGNVHTNGLENFWSLLKRGIKGTYVSIEPFHLFRYLDEQVFRYNNRKDKNDAERFNLALSQILGKRLTYQQLTGKTQETQTLPN